MAKRNVIGFASLVCVVAMTIVGRAQQAPPPPAGDAREGGPAGFNIMVAPPLTRLDAIAAQRGVLVIKGFTDIGTLNVDDGSSVLVSAVQFSDDTSKESGVAVYVTQQVEGRAVMVKAYVDADELDGLIEAVESLAKLGEGASPMQQFEARYQTLGALELTSTNAGGARMILVRAMQIVPGVDQPIVATAQVFASRLPEFAQRLTAAKEVLGKVK